MHSIVCYLIKLSLIPDIAYNQTVVLSVLHVFKLKQNVVQYNCELYLNIY